MAGARQRASMILPLLALVWACEGPPLAMADCASLAPTEREDCRLRFALALLDQPEELRAAIAAIPEPDSRDLLLLRLAVAEPTRAGAFCADAASEPAREKCRQVLGRPHLSTTPQAPR